MSLKKLIASFVDAAFRGGNAAPTGVAKPHLYASGRTWMCVDQLKTACTDLVLKHHTWVPVT